MGCGPSRHGHSGARDGSPPRVGCAATNRTPGAPAPTLQSSEGRGYRSFGTVTGRPGDDDDCLARDRLSSLLESAGATSRQGIHLRVAHDSPNDRNPSGFRPRGSDAASFGMRASGAQAHTPPGVDARGERSFHQVRGRPPKDGEKELEPPAPLFGASAGSRTSLFGDASRSRRQPRAFGRLDRRGGPSSGRIHRHPTDSFGAQ